LNIITFFFFLISFNKIKDDLIKSFILLLSWRSPKFVYINERKNFTLYNKNLIYKKIDLKCIIINIIIIIIIIILIILMIYIDYFFLILILLLNK